MSADEGKLALLLEERDGATRLLSPAVGLFTCARGRGALVGPGEEVGVLLVLQRALRLVVPEGVQGRVVGERPERVHEPVGFRQPLYELAPIAAGEGAALEGAKEAGAAAGLVLRSNQAGRFYRRPTPDAPAFVEPGAVLEEGAPIGLIEVMKTFAHVHYRATGGLPKRAKVLRVLAEDGAELEDGQPLLELEPA